MLRPIQKPKESSWNDRPPCGTCQINTSQRAAIIALRCYHCPVEAEWDNNFFRNYHFPERRKHSETDKSGSGKLNDSIWATVLGVAKTFGVTDKYALYEISFVNALLYSRAIPMPGDSESKKDAPLYDASKDANNDIDLSDSEDEIIVKKWRLMTDFPLQAQ